ncbi:MULTISPECIES: helix-turn-helix domain-containing protein [Pantoea]|nr:MULTISPECIES: helix-turn-helix transcriptional regulator [Pantoea]
MFGSYDGLTLEPASALSNISSLISAVRIIGLMEGENYKGINSELMEIAHEYAMAASDTRFLTPQKSNAAFASSSSTPLGPFYYPTASTIGSRIKSMRELRNLSRFYLASSVGVTRSCIEAWEENTTIPASDKIIPLASALSCDPMWLLTGEDSTRQASTGIGEQQHHHVSRPADDLP